MAKNEIVKKHDEPGITRDSITEVMRTRGLSLSRQVTLEQGQLLQGVFLGAGAPAELDSMDPAKKARGEKDQVSTWRIKGDGVDVIFIVLGSAGLDKHLAPLAPGTFVAIQHLGRTQTRKGFMVNDFAVAVSETPNAG